MDHYPGLPRRLSLLLTDSLRTRLHILIRLSARPRLCTGADDALVRTAEDGTATAVGAGAEPDGGWGHRNDEKSNL